MEACPVVRLGELKPRQREDAVQEGYGFGGRGRGRGLELQAMSCGVMPCSHPITHRLELQAMSRFQTESGLPLTLAVTLITAVNISITIMMNMPATQSVTLGLRRRVGLVWLCVLKSTPACWLKANLVPDPKPSPTPGARSVVPVVAGLLELVYALRRCLWGLECHPQRALHRPHPHRPHLHP